MTRAPAFLAALLALAAPGVLRAQTTDGYHQDMVFPVVVDTASFAQRFSFRNPTQAELTLTIKYFPAAGTSATAMSCTPLAIPAGGNATAASLRALCPALPAGSQFGFLRVRAALPAQASGPALFAGFSRVANPQGNGFAVEAFPAHAFTSATSVVAGVRRLAAGAGAPAFQTNCFIGNLDEQAPVGAAPATAVHYTLFNSAGASIGSGDLNLAPGQMVRLLDAFAVAPAGDYNDATIRFEELGPEEPGILAFCTVQDNSSFGADFRVAKQELADGGLTGTTTLIGAQDASAARETRRDDDLLGRGYTLPAGRTGTNVHMMYFHHPDFVSCQLEDPQTGAPLTASAKLELRLQRWDFNELIAGGDGIAGFGAIYLGDKTDRNGGSSTRYRISVRDSTGADTTQDRHYRLHCRSGSGHTLGDITAYQGL